MTEILRRLHTGDREALDVIMPLVYDELKKLARSHLRRELKAVPLETTALVHEAFLKLAGTRHPSYENRAHFYGIASRLMRQVLVDSARTRNADKRGPSQEVAVRDLPDRELEPSRPVLVLHDVLAYLEKADPLKGRLIEMRYFGGMTANECGEALSMPAHTVRRELRLAQAWLRKEMASREATT
jgi:RNA polymerase sigma factor (TIGR02999 family)